MKKILIVDDEVDITHLLRDYLNENFKCEIDISHDGVNANYKINHVNYDLIISDFRMPTIDGGEFVTNLKENNRLNSQAKFVFISGYIEEAMEFKKYANVYFLEKPINFTDLQNVITDIFGNYSKSAA